MNRFLAGIKLISNWCLTACVTMACVSLLLMTLLITVDVIGRKLLRPTGVAQEISGYLLVSIVFLGLAYALKEGTHIKIDLVTSKLAPKAQRWLETSTSLIGVFFCTWLIWFTAGHAVEYYTQGSRSMTFLHVPLWVVQIIVPVGLGLFALVALLRTIEAFVTYRARQKNT